MRVPDAAAPLFAPWSVYYTITGSAAAALTGLVFVIITLVAGLENLRGNRDGTSTFTTPTVVHFAAAFLVSAALCAPWQSQRAPGALLMLAGACGLAYGAWVLRRSFHLRNYRMDWEDWTGYTLLPLLSYGTLSIAGLTLLHSRSVPAMYAVAAAVMVLILTSIHNAWDVVTFLASGEAERLPDDPPE